MAEEEDRSKTADAATEDSRGRRNDGIGFGLELLQADDRLRLFTFTTTPERFRYLAILRVFDRARQRYEAQLHTAKVAAELGADEAEADDNANLESFLDRLTGWGILHRAHDSSRVASIAEYRRRSSVYQMTEVGFLAYTAVESVIRARPSDVELRRLAFPAILSDLEGLASANRAGDANKVNVLLDRLHGVLTEMTQRSARFYLMLGDLARTHDARPEVFLRHKDLLLGHLTEFLVELQRYRPIIARAVRDVASTGEDLLVSRAASVDASPFATEAERIERWRSHWRGIVAWFVGSIDEPCSADRLDRHTAAAISHLVSLLRRVTEGRRGGVSRESQLKFLARWFMATESDSDAHALFSAAFGLRAARHLAIGFDDPDVIAANRSWWNAPPVQVTTTFREHGKPPSPGRPAPLPDKSRERAAALEIQKARRAAQAAAEDSLVQGGIAGRILNRDELQVLLRLLDLALQTRASVVGTLPSRRGALAAEGRTPHVRIRLRRADHATVVETVDGRLTIPSMSVEVEDVTSPRAEPRRLKEAVGE
jgi:uncharacterized protein (TIGR02677 family)